MTPQFRGVFFFWLLYKSVTLEYLCRACASVVFASQSHAHAYCVCPSLLWVIERLYRERQSVSIVRGKTPLSSALCLIATSLPLSQCPFLVATQMNSIATWDLLTMIELCRDLKFLWCDLVSTAYTSLCSDKEKSGRDKESPFLACRDRIPMSHAHLCRARQRPVVRPWPGMSYAHGLLCRDTTQRRTVVHTSLHKLSPVVCGRAFCRGQLCRDLKILCHDRNSLYHSQLYHDIEFSLS